jgi:hypothetical protein
MLRRNEVSLSSKSWQPSHSEMGVFQDFNPFDPNFLGLRDQIFAMNNDQFRRLVLAGTSDNSSKAHDTSAPHNSALGSRHRSMTPRSVRGGASALFARPSNIDGTAQTRGKEYKSIAPKGSKLGAGYRDRTQDRHDDSADDKAKRIEALEKHLKDGEIEQDEFERVRDEITGGQVENTHLVKGLDWRLLERIKRGEDLNAPAKVTETQSAKSGDLDNAFDELERQEIKAIQKNESEKKGTLVPAPIAGKKRTRDEILAELKASRKKVAEANAAPQLGSKFRKIGDKDQSKQSNGTTSTESKSKRHETIAEPEPTTNLVPLDHDVVVPKNLQPPPDEESDDDIYADLGDEYNPLGGLSDSDEEDATTQTDQKVKSPETAKQPRTYFDDASTSVLSKIVNPLQDPTVLAALAQRSQETQSQAAEKSALPLSEEARLKRRAEMLAAQDRDLEDMDLGFGSSRFDDAEEMAMEGSNIKLLEWKGGNRDGYESGEGDAGSKKGKKARKPKKWKGNKNSMEDVMRVIEGRKT